MRGKTDEELADLVSNLQATHLLLFGEPLPRASMQKFLQDRLQKMRDGLIAASLSFENPEDIKTTLKILKSGVKHVGDGRLVGSGGAGADTPVTEEVREERAELRGSPRNPGEAERVSQAKSGSKKRPQKKGKGNSKV